MGRSLHRAARRRSRTLHRRPARQNHGRLGRTDHRRGLRRPHRVQVHRNDHPGLPPHRVERPLREILVGQEARSVRRHLQRPYVRRIVPAAGARRHPRAARPPLRRRRVPPRPRQPGRALQHPQRSDAARFGPLAQQPPRRRPRFPDRSRLHRAHGSGPAA